MKLRGVTISGVLLCLGAIAFSGSACSVNAGGTTSSSGTSSGTSSGVSSGSGSGGSGGTAEPGISDFPGCTEDDSLGCAGDALGITCPGGTQPDTSSYDCSIPVSNSDGTDSYCCITFDAGGSCAPDDSVTCPDPDSYGFTCTTPGDTPDTFDCTLTCSVDQGTGAFCCVDGGTCGSSGSSGGGSSGGGAGLDGDPCSDDTDCESGFCDGGYCGADSGTCSADGDSCSQDSDCCTSLCSTSGVCDATTGTDCTSDDDCASGVCDTSTGTCT